MTEEQRKLAAIVFTDIVGYTALTQRDEAHALQVLEKHNALLRSILSRHHGREVKTIGDAFLLEFESALDATLYAIEVQQILSEYNSHFGDSDKINVRIGLHVGDVIHQGTDVFGDAVNIASRIIPLAGAGEISISQQVFDQIWNKVNYKIVELGPRNLKNIESPIAVYKILPIKVTTKQIILPISERTSGPPVPLGEPSLKRTKVTTGHSRLDEALQGGLIAGSGIVLSAPASDEVPNLLRDFLRSDHEPGLLICKNLSSSQTIVQDKERITSLICSSKPVSPARNALPGKGIENLTELNLTIHEAISSVGPKRVALDVLSDILLRHKALQTRKWLNELLERLRSRGITTLAVLNPYMHPKEDVQAVMDLFDGNLEIIEKEIDGTLRKFMRINWMHGVEIIEKEFQFTDSGLEAAIPARAAVVPIVSVESRWRIPLIGRREELSQLKMALDRSLTNKASIVVLQGQTGTGKTRLMQELALYAQSKRAVVLSGSASEDGLPYAPWMEACRQFVAQAPGEVLRRMLGPHISEIVKLVPDIAAKLRTISTSESPDDQQDKYRFYEGVFQFFVAISNGAPLVLLFDDMEYADQPSLDLMEYFVRNTNKLRSLMICAIPNEFEAASHTDRTLMKLNRQRLLETISLKNLNRDETGNVIKQAFDEKVASPEFTDLVYQRTAGNPFFIEEVMRSLTQDGTIRRAEGGWERKEIQEITIPKSVKNVLKARLAKLDSETLNVLTIASVAGLKFDFKILLDTSQLDEDALLEKIEKVLSTGLILEVPRELNTFKFADYLIRELLLGDLSHIRRAKYHLKIAEAMEKHYTKEMAESRADIIADHFLEAGDVARTIKYSIMGGDRNTSIHAYEQAIVNYKCAAEVIGEGDNEERASIFEKLGHSFRLAGHKESSARNLKLALSTFERLHDYKSCARVSVELSMVAGDDGGIDVLKQALRFVERIPESFEAAAIYSELASDLATLDKYDEANIWNERALKAGEKSGNFAAIADALGSKAGYFLDTGRIDRGLPLSEKALETAVKHDLYRQARIQFLNLAYYTLCRSLPKAREFASQWYEFAKQENTLPSQARSLAALSFFDWLAGNWTLALEEMLKAFQMQEQHDFKFTAYMAEVPRGLIHLSLGDLEQAENYIQKSFATQDSKITTIVGVHLALGKLRMEQGRVEEARQHFETCVNAFKAAEFSTAPLFNIEALLHLATIYSRQGELKKARKASQWAKRLAETLKSDAGLAMAYQAEAAVLVASGEQRAAEAAYLHCLTEWKKAGWIYYYAKALAEYAEAQTNRVESEKSLRQAVEIFTKLQAKRDLERAKTKLHETR